MTDRSDAADARPAPTTRPRRPRRVTTTPPAGSDPQPSRASATAEPDRHTLDENDDRLLAEKPPHY